MPEAPMARTLIIAVSGEGFETVSGVKRGAVATSALVSDVLQKK
jgi:hypothetical protein